MTVNIERAPGRVAGRNDVLFSLTRASLIKVSLLVMLAGCMLASVPAVAAADNCELGSRYEKLAAKATADFRRADALEAMERAVEACGTSAYWHKLGSLAASFGEDSYNERAAEAFVKAHDLGTDNSARARAAASYAELLFHTGDRTRAVEMIYQARNLDPSNTDILASAETMVEATKELTDEDIRRGVSDQMFAPLVLNKVDVATAAASGAANSSGGAAAQASSAVSQAQNSAAERRIRVQLQFESGSTTLSELSRNNLATLVRSLATLDADQQFIFEGHADARGPAADNRRLSQQRAESVRDLVVQMEQNLAGRILVRGRGEDELLSFGNLPSDHQANRRLVVKYQVQ